MLIESGSTYKGRLQVMQLIALFSACLEARCLFGMHFQRLVEGTPKFVRHASPYRHTKLAQFGPYYSAPCATALFLCRDAPTLKCNSHRKPHITVFENAIDLEAIFCTVLSTQRCVS